MERFVHKYLNNAIANKTTNNIFDNGLYTNLLNNTIANKTTDNKILHTSKHKYRENNQTRYFE